MTRRYGGILASAVAIVLLGVPPLLVGIPRFTQNGFPGPYTRADAILVFFVGIPVLFALVALVRVAQYYDLIGGAEDPY